MELTAQQITENWEVFLISIENYISEPRRSQLLNFYKEYEERFAFMPASYKKEFHGCYPGGYVVHINKVVEASLELYKLWNLLGANMETFTTEELIFSAINHDLGKFGDYENESYIPQQDPWRRDKLEEKYMFNTALPFASVPDRTLFILQDLGIKYSFNEMIAIQTHDGLYDEANKKYLQGFLPEQKPRTILPYILHQADIIAARIEFDLEYANKFDLNASRSQSDKNIEKPIIIENKQNKTLKTKTLGSLSNNNLINILNGI